MTTTVKQTGPEWERIMRRLAQRDGVIELSRRRDPRKLHQQKITRNDDGSFDVTNAQSWKVRVFEVLDDAIIVERPWSATNYVELQPGESLDGLMVDSLRRWTFRCRMIEQFRYDLNEHKQVVSLRLSRPEEMRDGQRRDYFRVETAGAALPSAHLWHLVEHDACAEYEQYCIQRHRACPEERDAIVEPARPPLGDQFDMMVMDISAGGIGALVKRDIEWLLPTAPLLWTKITLPDVEEPLFVVSRVAHWHDETTDLIKLGLCFDFSHHLEYRRFFVEQMCRFSAEFQRQQLQRKR